MKTQSAYYPWIVVGVAALGYFVDVFDILLFSIVRTVSLKDLGLQGDALLSEGIFLLNSQMAGMLIGGVLFGVWGDKRGRLSVLFGSILLYSIANLLNALVTSVPMYAAFRFAAGIGLAGELGAGVTLVSEILPREKRGIGTTIIATVGVAGALVASIVTQYMAWRTAYVVAGLMGFALLALRWAVRESTMFEQLKSRGDIRRGDLTLLWAKPERLKRFVYCLLAGVPIYFVLGVLVTFAPELGKNLGFGETLTAGNAVFYAYIGYIAGDLLTGLTSQWMRSRRKAMSLYIVLTAIGSFALLHAAGRSLTYVYVLYTFVGLFAGYWAVFITSSAEQFGTNLRATVATSIPNFVRGMVIPMTLTLKTLKENWGFVGAAQAILVVVTLIALFCAASLRETFTADLDYLET